MEKATERTESLLGSDAMNKLKNSHVAVFGLGGVGSYTAEALARTGVGKLTLIDCDVYSGSNLNRQLFATAETMGRKKTDAARERLNKVAPGCVVQTVDLFYTPETADQIDLTAFDAVADAIDTVSGKIELISRAFRENIPIVSCMGTGNRLDPTMLRVKDLYETQNCPLARVMRHELRKRGVTALPVVCSDEPGVKVVAESEHGRHAPGSAVFVPAAAGMTLAAEIVRRLAG